MNTNDKKIMLDHKQLKKMIWSLLEYKLPDKTQTKNFTSNSIDKWTNMIKEEKEVEERFDKNNFKEALTTLFALNPNLSELTEEAPRLAPSIQTCF